MSSEILNIFENKKYARLALENNKAYMKKKPYPHIYFDNFLPKKIALALSEEYPKFNSRDKNWKFHKNDNVIRHFLEDNTKFKTNLRLFSMLINSRSFLSFIEALTGLESVIPDPYFMGGGAMSTGKGGFLNVHADFNFHHKLQSWRRLNVLFYLTPKWQKKWHGNLEIWSNDKKKKVAGIEPLFNRVVIISSTSNTFHGQPTPLECPRNIYRNVFSAFFYTTKRDKKTLTTPHYTRYSIKNNAYAQQIRAKYKKSAY